MESKSKKQERKIMPTEMIVLGSTSYHYWRFWVSDILKDTNAKFKKDEKSWNGAISTSKDNYEKANKLLNEYKLHNPEVKNLWWRHTAAL